MTYTYLLKLCLIFLLIIERGWYTSNNLGAYPLVLVLSVFCFIHFKALLLLDTYLFIMSMPFWRVNNSVTSKYLSLSSAEVLVLKSTLSDGGRDTATFYVYCFHAVFFLPFFQVQVFVSLYLKWIPCRYLGLDALKSNMIISIF